MKTSEFIVNTLNEKMVYAYSKQEFIEMLESPPTGDELEDEEYKWLVAMKFNDEWIDFTKLDLKYGRRNDHVSYWFEFGEDVIGIVGSYDSWAGTEWDGDWKIGKVKVITDTIFV